MARPEHHDDEAGFEDAAVDEIAFAREVELIRSVANDPVELSDAPADLWQSIAAAAGIDAGQGTTPGVAGAAGAGTVAGTESSAGPVSEHDPAAVVDLGARRRWRTVLVAAAAVIAVVAGVGVFAATRPDAEPTELAAAELLPFEGAQVGDAAGQVELIDDGEQLSLRVDMRDLPAPAPGTFYELWLIDPATGEPVSVATMKDGSSDVATEIALPAGADPDRYDVVDVSVQEEDAGPEHSGNSVLRGTLSA